MGFLQITNKKSAHPTTQDSHLHHRFPTFENPFPLRAKTKV